MSFQPTQTFIPTDRIMPSKSQSLKTLLAILLPALTGMSALIPLNVEARNMPVINVTSPEDNIKTLSDEDLLNPRKLAFDRVVLFVDSFDAAPVGRVFVSKRSILGHPKYGVIGEKGSDSYNQKCLFVCPGGTSDIDATYVYVIEKKGECTIGVRGIGWAEKEEEWQGEYMSGKMVETGRVRFTSTADNINAIAINSKLITPAINASQLTGPHGTNYKYFPRKRNFLGVQTTSNEGYITDIHYFPATQLVKVIRAGGTPEIEVPNWKPSRIVISGKPLEELKTLVEKCDLDS